MKITISRAKVRTCWGIDCRSVERVNAPVLQRFTQRPREKGRKGEREGEREREREREKERKRTSNEERKQRGRMEGGETSWQGERDTDRE